MGNERIINLVDFCSKQIKELYSGNQLALKSDDILKEGCLYKTAIGSITSPSLPKKRNKFMLFSVYQRLIGNKPLASENNDEFYGDKYISKSDEDKKILYLIYLVEKSLHDYLINRETQVPEQTNKNIIKDDITSIWSFISNIQIRLKDDNNPPLSEVKIIYTQLSKYWNFMEEVGIKPHFINPDDYVKKITQFNNSQNLENNERINMLIEIGGELRKEITNLIGEESPHENLTQNNWKEFVE